jgi:ABC-type Na+ efflux pump permease subunit
MNFMTNDAILAAVLIGSHPPRYPFTLTVFFSNPNSGVEGQTIFHLHAFLSAQPKPTHNQTTTATMANQPTNQPTTQSATIHHHSLNPSDQPLLLTLFMLMLVFKSVFYVLSLVTHISHQ